ncbi:hypothetical protein hbim_05395 [Mycolicibacterium mageritense]|uniref:ESX-1 secretion-associated protein n=2 Tax=Mycolicibacterium mageritense TaxID=53462 RepID=A0AAI8TUY5_MYCME|nr:hypothetical protein hbim_05395 [Mycolicibacterium mageritense]
MAADLQAKHEAAHVRMEAAQPGWVGTSGEALRGMVAKFRADSKTLVGDVTDHGRALRAAAEAYRETDAHLAAKIKSASGEMPSGDTEQ